MQKKYIVRLTDQERVTLMEVVKKLKGTSQKVRRAQVLLKADADGPAWTDKQIAEAYACRTKTVENIRQRLVEQGFEETLNWKRRANPPTEKAAQRRTGGENHCSTAWATSQGLCPLDATVTGTEGGGTGNRRIGQSRDGASYAHTRQACRLRVRASWHRQHFHVYRTSGGLALGRRSEAENEVRLGGRDGTLTGRALRRLRKGDRRLRQPQHTHQRSLLRSV